MFTRSTIPVETLLLHYILRYYYVLFAFLLPFYYDFNPSYILPPPSRALPRVVSSCRVLYFRNYSAGWEKVARRWFGMGADAAWLNFVCIRVVTRTMENEVKEMRC